MNIEFGIVGLPQSGRTTLFNALTAGQAGGGGQSRGGTHLGVAQVADARLDALGGLLRPERTVMVSVSYIDMGASVKGLVDSKEMGGQLLNQLSAVDALITVVRDFESDAVPHPAGGLDVDRDIAAMNLELTFSDLAILERRLERIAATLKAARSAERVPLGREQSLLARVKGELEQEIPIREQDLSAEDTRAINHFQFLTAKPLLVVINVGENRVPEAAALEAQLNTTHARPGCRVVVLCGKLEMELTQLAAETAEVWRAEFGLSESGLDHVIRASYDLLGLVTFFTGSSSEIRAWPVPGGTLAPAAAGKVHTDMQRGFIRAEVISLDDLLACGGFPEARKRGLLRQEGKTYVVRDADVITFLFNV